MESVGKEYLWLGESGEELMSGLIAWLQQCARSRRGWLALQSLPAFFPAFFPAFPAFFPACRPREETGPEREGAGPALYADERR